MKLKINEIAHLPSPPQIVVQSFEGSIYRMVARTAEREYLIVDNKGESLTSRHPNDLTELVQGFIVESVKLEHHSAFDEMIGHEAQGRNNSIPPSNTLIVDLEVDTFQPVGETKH